jgi:hypothetical protein
MARPSLFTSGKWKRTSHLARVRLSICPAQLLGHLEMMWQVADGCGDTRLGRDLAGVEAACGWEGEPGALGLLLQHEQWIDTTDEGFEIHDYWHHCPDYVKKRLTREEERKTRGEERAGIARSLRDKPDRSLTGQGTATDRSLTAENRSLTDTPAPAPAPAPEKKGEVAREALPGSPSAADTTPGGADPELLEALKASMWQPPPAPPNPAKRPRREKPQPILDVPELPPILDTADFRAALRRRLEERAGQPGREARQTMPQIQAQLGQLAKLATAAGVERAVFCVDRAAGGHYQGIVFAEDFEPPRTNGNGKGGKHGPTPWSDLDKASRNMLRELQGDDLMRCNGDKNLARERFPEHWPEGS